MAKDKQKKERNLNRKFLYDGSETEYNFQLKKKRNLWWLLLLLLPLLLLIPLKKDITVVVQTIDGTPIPNTDVSMSYSASYLLWDWEFLVEKPYDAIQQTDDEGVTVFKDLGYSVFSFIFHFNRPIVFTAGCDCYETMVDTCRFHTTRKVVMKLNPVVTDIRLKVVDSELGFELAGALVECEYDGKEGRTKVVDTTDAAGCVVLKDARLCGDFNSIKASADGYADTMFTDMSVQKLLEAVGAYEIPLRPLKDRFIFFVKDRYTKEPVPYVEADVTLTYKGAVVSGGRSRTNVDGLGQGFYDDARLLAKVDITVEESTHYKAGRLEGDYTVREFKDLPDSLRVIWLEPKPYTVQFINIDTLSLEPIKGVTNEILIDGIDGTKRKDVVLSNANGHFPVTAMAGDKITIKSTLDPYYYPKTTVIEKFKEADTIYMRPKLLSLEFRTIEVVDGKTTGVLPDCDLVVTVNGDHVPPTNSGSGTFTVSNIRLGSSISIVASKEYYFPNDTKIKDKSVDWLYKAPQAERDIELEKMDRFNVDLVMCIDNTSSMKSFIDMVKTNAISFFKDLNEVCKRQGKVVVEARLKVISYGDLEEAAMKESPFYDIPAESGRYNSFVNGITITDGMDRPEDGLEALAAAINSSWKTSTINCRQIIVVYTDATNHDLGTNRSSPYYPKSGMPANFSELTNMWKSMDPDAARLILFAPNEGSWGSIKSSWSNVYMKSLDDVLGKKSGYNEILETISSTL